LWKLGEIAWCGGKVCAVEIAMGAAGAIALDRETWT